MFEVCSLGKQNMSMQSYMKLAKELLALINNLEDISLADTLTVACFLQATALTLSPPLSRSCTNV